MHPPLCFAGDVECPLKVASQSVLIKTMAEGDKNATEFPVTLVKTKVLQKIVE